MNQARGMRLGSTFTRRSYGSYDRGGGPNIQGGSATRGRGEDAMNQRGEHRGFDNSVGILDRVSKALVNGKNWLTHEESVEVDAALRDIVVRLERVAEAVAAPMQLSKPAAALKNLDLTEREMEILGYLAEGKTNAEIAAHCWISKNTVKFHVKNLFRKLEVRNRAQAMMIAKGVRPTINSVT